MTIIIIINNNTWKTRNQGTTKNSHTGHCTHTTGSINVKVQNIFHVRNYITCNKTKQNSCNIMYLGNMVCFRYIIVNTLHKDDDDGDDNNNNNNNEKFTVCAK